VNPAAERPEILPQTMTPEEMQHLGEQVVDVLRTIYDPEIPVDIYELGLVYDVQVSDEGSVNVLMTLTSPNCPVAETLPVEVKEKVQSLDAVRDAEVEITFEPPWTKDMMSEEARLELGTAWRKVRS
jgi:FeS assembly SUF system protein